jgi:hypothetical protein
MKIAENVKEHSWNAFTEVAEALNNQCVALMLHAVADFTSEHVNAEYAWIVELHRASQDSYNMEQFAYDEDSWISNEIFDDFDSAKARYLELLAEHIIDLGI